MATDRATYVGGSEIGAIANVDRFNTPLDIYLKKRGEAPPTKVNPHMKRGLFLEPHIIEQVAKESGYAVHRAKFIRHETKPWIAGTPDGYLVPGAESERKTHGILEAKAPKGSVFARVVDEGPLESWVLQTQWYMLVAGFTWGIIAVFSADDWTLKIFEVEADPDLQSKLMALGEQFWNRLQEGKPPPEGEKIDWEIPKVAGEAELREDEPWSAAIDAYGSATRLLKQAEELEIAAKARIKELAGGFGKFIGGGGKVTYALQAGRETFQKKIFIAEHPEIDIQDYYQRGEPFERMNVTVKED